LTSRPLKRKGLEFLALKAFNLSESLSSAPIGEQKKGEYIRCFGVAYPAVRRDSYVPEMSGEKIVLLSLSELPYIVAFLVL
jgi:hypothetical protein